MGIRATNMAALLVAGILAAGCAHAVPAPRVLAQADAPPPPSQDEAGREGAEIESAAPDEPAAQGESAIEQFLRSKAAQPAEEQLPESDFEFLRNPPITEEFLFGSPEQRVEAPETVWQPAEQDADAPPLFDALGEEAKSNYVRGALLGQGGFGARSAEYFVEAAQRDPENLYLKSRAARALLAQNDLPRAQRLIDEIFAADPQNIDAILMSASLAEYRNDKAKAREWHEKALEVRPRNLTALSNLARMAYYDDQDLERTKELCGLILTTGRRSQPEFLNALLWNAEANALTGDVAGATELYRQLVGYRPSLISRLADMGVRLERMGRRAEATELFRQGVLMAPEADGVLRRWEDLVAGDGGQDAVRAAYAALTAEFPLDLRVQELFATYLLRTGDLDGLVEQRNRMLEVEPRHIPSLLSLARVAWSRDQREKATELYERAIASGPDDPSAYRDVAVAYMDQGNLERAEQLLTEAFAMDPKNADTLLALAALAEKLENPEQTERFLRSALDAAPANERILRLFAGFLRRQGKVARAGEVFEQVLAVSPDDVSTMVELAGIYFETGNAEALDRLQDGAARELQDPLVFYINYGVLSMGAAEFDRARWAFERALRIVPEDLSTRSTLADAYLHLGEREYAVKALTDGEPHVPEEARVAYHLRLMGLYQDMHDQELALAQAQKVVELDPANPEHHGLLLVQLVRAGRGDEAMERLNDFVREFMPKDPVAAKRVRADVLLERGEVERALGEMRILHADNPADAQIEFALAHLYAEAGQPGNAERHYRHLIETLAGNDELGGLYVRSLNNLAFTLCEAEIRLEEALELAEQALALAPNADYILDTKGRILYRMGRLEESLTWLREAERRSFGDPEILGHLGDLQRALGQPSTARRYYDRALELDPGNESIRERMARLESELSPGEGRGAAAATP